MIMNYMSSFWFSLMIRLPTACKGGVGVGGKLEILVRIELQGKIKEFVREVSSHL